MGYKILLLLLIIILFYIIFKYGKKESFKTNNSQNTKKIAFLFLIYDKINNEDLWFNFLKNVDKNKYNIYIHYKENKQLKHFEKFKIKENIETCWGCLSVVLAQNILLKEALKDKDNQHFIWLSGSCVPIKSFNFIYNYLDIHKSYYNIMPDTQVFPRANNVLKYIEKQNVKKYNMASIINRKHANLFVDNDNNIKLWFKNIQNVDEIVYLSLIYHNNLQDELITTPNIAAGSIIFAPWDDMSNYKRFDNSKKKNSYTYEFICPEELDYLINSKSLFARKFLENCSGLYKLNEVYKHK
jgi:hypothetical protein